MVYDSPHKLDRATLKAEGARASDPPQGGDAVGLARFEAGYAVKDGGEMGRVKPAPKARTMTNGRFPEATRYGPNSYSMIASQSTYKDPSSLARRIPLRNASLRLSGLSGAALSRTSGSKVPTVGAAG